jgi:hypothetical protein
MQHPATKKQTGLCNDLNTVIMDETVSAGNHYAMR